MCLLIDPRMHKKFFRYKPLIAKKDILVYKELVHFKDGIETPIQEYKINFENGTTTLTAKFKFIYKFFLKRIFVTEGIHAYRLIPTCYLNKLSFIHCAIIPKGTPYYLGTCKDIVAEKLIIFEEPANFINPKEYKDTIKFLS